MTTQQTRQSCRLVVTYEPGIDTGIAEQLKEQLQAIAVFNTDDCTPKQLTTIATHVLTIKAHPAALYQIGLAPAAKPRQILVIDFNKGALGFRLQHSNPIKQSLAKATGLSKGVRPFILDATAGLGRDSFILASLGCRVDMMERSGIMRALLHDGLRRASIESKTEAICKRMALFHTDAIAYLRGKISVNKMPLPYDTIYLDPMYPHRTKSALVKKEMRLTRELIGDDIDAEELFALAIASDVKRIVVKRSKGAAPLGSSQFHDGSLDITVEQNKVPAIKPSFTIDGKTTRFDVYYRS